MGIIYLFYMTLESLLQATGAYCIVVLVSCYFQVPFRSLPLSLPSLSSTAQHSNRSSSFSLLKKDLTFFLVKFYILFLEFFTELRMERDFMGLAVEQETSDEAIDAGN